MEVYKYKYNIHFCIHFPFFSYTLLPLLYLVLLHRQSYAYVDRTNINININSTQIKQNIVEVLTSLSLTPTKDNFEKIDTKITYSTIVEFNTENIQKEEMEKIILIDIPNEIYSEVREIFVFLFKNSGFKDVKINERVDFEKLYKMKKIQ